LIAVLVLSAGVVYAQTVPQVNIREIQEVSDSLLNLGQDASPLLGDTLWLRGVVATAPRVNPSGPYLWFTGDRWRFILRDPSETIFSWITIVAADTAFFRDSVGIDQLFEGDSVEILGRVTEYRTLTQFEPMRSDTALRLLGISSEPLEPVDLPLSSFFNGTDKVLVPGEYYESGFVRLQNLTVIGVSGAEFIVADIQQNQIEVDDQSDLIFNGPPPPSPGANIGMVQGIMFTNSALDFTINPRDTSAYTVLGFAPTITSLGRLDSIPGPSTAVTIQTEIIDFDGTVTDARVFYSVNDVPQGSFALTSLPDSIYEYTIPAVGVDSAYVSYYFAATDNNSVQVFDPPDTATARHFYLSLNRAPGIRDIQFNPYGGGSSYDGYWLTASGITTTDRLDYGAIYIQDGVGPWSGIRIFSDADSSIRRGDDLTVTGLIRDAFDQTIMDQAAFLTNSTGNPLPPPSDALAGDVLTGGPMAEAYESVLIQINSVYVVNINEDAISSSNFGEWGMHEDDQQTSGLRVNDFSNHLPYTNDTTRAGDSGKTQLHVGDYFQSMRGVMAYSFSQFKLEPRDAADFTGYQPVTSVERTSEMVPFEYSLGQNYPNPFNPSTTIEYAVPKASRVTLTIYNLLGQQVALVVDDFQIAGTYRVRVDSNLFSRFASGVYFYHLSAGDFSLAKKMILLR
jgi:hypothetical protein